MYAVKMKYGVLILLASASVALARSFSPPCEISHSSSSNWLMPSMMNMLAVKEPCYKGFSVKAEYNSFNPDNDYLDAGMLFSQYQNWKMMMGLAPPPDNLEEDMTMGHKYMEFTLSEALEDTIVANLFLNFEKATNPGESLLIAYFNQGSLGWELCGYSPDVDYGGCTHDLLQYPANKNGYRTYGIEYYHADGKFYFSLYINSRLAGATSVPLPPDYQDEVSGPVVPIFTAHTCEENSTICVRGMTPWPTTEFKFGYVNVFDLTTCSLCASECDGNTRCDRIGTPRAHCSCLPGFSGLVSEGCPVNATGGGIDVYLCDDNTTCSTCDAPVSTTVGGCFENLICPGIEEDAGFQTWLGTTEPQELFWMASPGLVKGKLLLRPFSRNASDPSFGCLPEFDLESKGAQGLEIPTLECNDEMVCGGMGNYSNRFIEPTCIDGPCTGHAACYTPGGLCTCEFGYAGSPTAGCPDFECSDGPCQGFSHCPSMLDWCECLPGFDGSPETGCVGQQDPAGPFDLASPEYCTVSGSSASMTAIDPLISSGLQRFGFLPFNDTLVKHDPLSGRISLTLTEDAKSGIETASPVGPGGFYEWHIHPDSQLGSWSFVGLLGGTKEIAITLTQKWVPPDPMEWWMPDRCVGLRAEFSILDSESPVWMKTVTLTNDDMMTFGIHWVPGVHVTFYVDGEWMAEYTGAEIPTVSLVPTAFIAACNDTWCGGTPGPVMPTPFGYVTQLDYFRYYTSCVDLCISACVGASICSQINGLCECKSGWGGVNCDVMICVDGPCVGNAVCNTPGSYCECSPGFLGSTADGCPSAGILCDVTGDMDDPMLNLTKDSVGPFVDKSPGYTTLVIEEDVGAPLGWTGERVFGNTNVMTFEDGIFQVSATVELVENVATFFGIQEVRSSGSDVIGAFVYPKNEMMYVEFASVWIGMDVDAFDFFGGMPNCVLELPMILAGSSHTYSIFAHSSKDFELFFDGVSVGCEFFPLSVDISSWSNLEVVAMNFECGIWGCDGMAPGTASAPDGFSATTTIQSMEFYNSSCLTVCNDVVPCGERFVDDRTVCEGFGLDCVCQGDEWGGDPALGCPTPLCVSPPCAGDAVCVSPSNCECPLPLEGENWNGCTPLDGSVGEICGGGSFVPDLGGYKTDINDCYTRTGASNSSTHILDSTNVWLNSRAHVSLTLKRGVNCASSPTLYCTSAAEVMSGNGYGYWEMRVTQFPNNYDGVALVSFHGEDIDGLVVYFGFEDSTSKTYVRMVQGGGDVMTRLSSNYYEFAKVGVLWRNTLVGPVATLYVNGERVGDVWTTPPTEPTIVRITMEGCDGNPACIGGGTVSAWDYFSMDLFRRYSYPMECTPCGDDACDSFVEVCNEIGSGSCDCITDFDFCGVCGGDNSTCADCMGMPLGTSVLDICGVCDGDDSDWCRDCNGDLHGGAVVDACGVCGGPDLDMCPSGGRRSPDCDVVHDWTEMQPDMDDDWFGPDGDYMEDPNSFMAKDHAIFDPCGELMEVMLDKDGVDYSRGRIELKKLPADVSSGYMEIQIRGPELPGGMAFFRMQSEQPGTDGSRHRLEIAVWRAQDDNQTMRALFYWSFECHGMDSHCDNNARLMVLPGDANVFHTFGWSFSTIAGPFPSPDTVGPSDFEDGTEYITFLDGMRQDVFVIPGVFDGYWGSELNLNQCTRDWCIQSSGNGGGDVPLGTYFEEPGYTAVMKEFKIFAEDCLLCEDSPCDENMMCNHINSMCECVPGWHGENCTDPIVHGEGTIYLCGNVTDGDNTCDVANCTDVSFFVGQCLPNIFCPGLENDPMMIMMFGNNGTLRISWRVEQVEPGKLDLFPYLAPLAAMIPPCSGEPATGPGDRGLLHSVGSCHLQETCGQETTPLWEVIDLDCSEVCTGNAVCLIAGGDCLCPPEWGGDPATGCIIPRCMDGPCGTGANCPGAGLLCECDPLYHGIPTQGCLPDTEPVGGPADVRSPTCVVEDSSVGQSVWLPFVGPAGANETFEAHRFAWDTSSGWMEAEVFGFGNGTMEYGVGFVNTSYLFGYYEWKFRTQTSSSSYYPMVGLTAQITGVTPDIGDDNAPPSIIIMIIKGEDHCEQILRVRIEGDAGMATSYEFDVPPSDRPGLFHVVGAELVQFDADGASALNLYWDGEYVGRLTEYLGIWLPRGGLLHMFAGAQACSGTWCGLSEDFEEWIPGSLPYVVDFQWARHYNTSCLLCVGGPCGVANGHVSCLDIDGLCGCEPGWGHLPALGCLDPVCHDEPCVGLATCVVPDGMCSCPAPLSGLPEDGCPGDAYSPTWCDIAGSTLEDGWIGWDTSVGAPFIETVLDETYITDHGYGEFSLLLDNNTVGLEDYVSAGLEVDFYPTMDGMAYVEFRASVALIGVVTVVELSDFSGAKVYVAMYQDRWEDLKVVMGGEWEIVTTTLPPEQSDNFHTYGVRFEEGANMNGYSGTAATLYVDGTLVLWDNPEAGIDSGMDTWSSPWTAKVFMISCNDEILPGWSVSGKVQQWCSEDGGFSYIGPRVTTMNYLRFYDDCALCDDGCSMNEADSWHTSCPEIGTSCECTPRIGWTPWFGDVGLGCPEISCDVDGIYGSCLGDAICSRPGEGCFCPQYTSGMHRNGCSGDPRLPDMCATMPAWDLFQYSNASRGIWNLTEVDVVGHYPNVQRRRCFGGICNNNTMWVMEDRGLGMLLLVPKWDLTGFVGGVITSANAVEYGLYEFRLSGMSEDIRLVMEFENIMTVEAWWMGTGPDFQWSDTSGSLNVHVGSSKGNWDGSIFFQSVFNTGVADTDGIGMHILHVLWRENSVGGVATAEVYLNGVLISPPVEVPTEGGAGVLWYGVEAGPSLNPATFISSDGQYVPMDMRYYDDSCYACGVDCWGNASCRVMNEPLACQCAAGYGLDPANGCPDLLTGMLTYEVCVDPTNSFYNCGEGASCQELVDVDMGDCIPIDCNGTGSYVQFTYGPGVEWMKATYYSDAGCTLMEDSMSLRWNSCSKMGAPCSGGAEYAWFSVEPNCGAACVGDAVCLMAGSTCECPPDHPGNPVYGCLGIGEDCAGDIDGPLEYDDCGICGGVNDVCILHSAYAGEDQDFCVATSVPIALDADPVTVGMGVWTSSGGTIMDPNNPKSMAVNVPVGTTTFTWSLTMPPLEGMDDMDSMTVHVYMPPGAVSAGSNVIPYCDGSSIVLNGSPSPTGYSGEWTVVEGPSTVVDPTAYDSQVLFLGMGANRFRWTITHDADVCATQYAEVVVDRRQYDACGLCDGAEWNSCLCSGANCDCTGVEGGAVQYDSCDVCGGSDACLDCNGDPFGLAELDECGVCGGTGTFDNNSICCQAPAKDPCGYCPPYPANCSDCTGLKGGNADYDVCGVCGGSGNCIVHVADAGVDDTVCGFAASLAANAAPPGGSFGVWTVLMGSGGFADANDPLTEVTSMSPGANVFRWTLNTFAFQEGLNTFDNVTITTFAPASAAYAGENQVVCTLNTLMAATSPPAGYQGIWTVNDPSMQSFADDRFASTALSGLPVGASSYTWTVVHLMGECPTTHDVVQITVDQEDVCGECGGTETDICMCPLVVCDCHAVPGGAAEIDGCGICGGLDASMDACGDCGGTETNACLCSGADCDCSGVDGGGLEYDDCGVCGGTGSYDSDGICCQEEEKNACGNCTYTPDCMDCTGVEGGIVVYDACGVCGGPGIPVVFCDCDGSVYDCLVVCNGTATFDHCGECNGDSKSCCNDHGTHDGVGCVCDSDYYGATCDSMCSSLCAVCDDGASGDGSCLACPVGVLGVECDASCPIKCGPGGCDDGPMGTGACVDCASGLCNAPSCTDVEDLCGDCMGVNRGCCSDNGTYTGATCVCDAKRYGSLCENECSSLCATCEDGASGDGHCLTCPTKFYGALCDQACDVACGSCSDGIGGNGDCTSCSGSGLPGEPCGTTCLSVVDACGDCDPALLTSSCCNGRGTWNGTDCTECLDDAYYGPTCNIPCCGGFGFCDLDSGVCHACVADHYGASCDLTCDPLCLTCNDGVSGDGACVTCPPLQYGAPCDLTCDPACLTCNDGVSGDGACESCPPRKFGPTCTQECSDNCVLCSDGVDGDGSCEDALNTDDPTEATTIVPGMDDVTFGGILGGGFGGIVIILFIVLIVQRKNSAKVEPAPLVVPMEEVAPVSEVIATEVVTAGEPEEETELTITAEP